MYKLIIEDDEGKTVVVPLGRDNISIGRQAGNIIRLTERNVSRRHAALVKDPQGQLTIEDLTSYNGTRVNGQITRGPTTLQAGDQVKIGDYRLAVQNASQAASMPGQEASPPSQQNTNRDATPATNPLSPPGAQLGTAIGSTVGDGSEAPSRGDAKPPSPLSTHAAEGTTDGSSAPASAAPRRSTNHPKPTVPMSTLAESAPYGRGDTVPVKSLADAGYDVEQSPKLLVVNSDFRGTAFPLDKSTLVLGRTDDNDIVLAHKSISRHHAKVVRDGNRHVILDLDSANGVRINGTEFERAELSSGDHIELGHVHLRFVEAGESFELGPEKSSQAAGS